MAQRGVRLKRIGCGATFALLVLSACAEPAPPPPPAAPAPPAVVTPAPPPRPAPPKDACGAAPLQYLIGRPRTEIPVPVDPSRRRVVCSTCMMTQDFIQSRLTIVYDSGNGLVKSVRCG
jgi:hypothetical protein